MRIKAMFSRGTIPIWMVLGWEVLGQIHEGKFAVEAWGDVNDFAQHHVLATFLVGLFALLTFAAWPEYIKPWWPSWLRITTMHETVHELHNTVMDPVTGHCIKLGRLDSVPDRLRTIESQLGQSQADAVTALQDVSNAITARFAKVEKDVGAMKEGAHKLSQAIQVNLNSIGDDYSALKQSITTLSIDGNNLKSRHLNTSNAVLSVCQGLSGFANVQGDLAVLISRAGLIVHYFELALNVYLSSGVSIPWRAGGDGPMQRELGNPGERERNSGMIPNAVPG